MARIMSPDFWLNQVTAQLTEVAEGIGMRDGNHRLKPDNIEAFRAAMGHGMYGSWAAVVVA